MKKNGRLVFVSVLLSCMVLGSLITSAKVEKVDVIERSIEDNDGGLRPTVSALGADDKFSGSANNLTVLERAQNTNASQSTQGLDSVQTSNNYIDLPPEWTGYKLYSEISGLSDNKTWQTNGELNGGDNWEYYDFDINQTAGDNNGSSTDENCWGYYAGPSVLSSDGITGTESGAIFTHVGYDGEPDDDWLDTREFSAFNQTVAFDRGEVSYVGVDFSYYSQHSTANDFAVGFVEFNGYRLLFDAFDAGNLDQWNEERLEIPTSDIPQVFDGKGEFNFSIGIDITWSAWWEGGTYFTKEIYFDNISIMLRAEATPTQMNLQLNGTNIVGDQYGVGNITTLGSWYNPSTTNTRPLLAEITTTGTDVNFETSLTSYVKHYESSQDSDADPNTDFFIESGNDANWTAYFYGAKPADYEEYNYTMYFPSDWDPWSAQDPFYSEVLNDLTYIPGSGSLDVPAERANNFPGLWKIEFSSPNYVQSLHTYQNTTETPGPQDWATADYIFAGDALNVTAQIKNDGEVDDISKTNATLQIRFPNGTLWTSETQKKFVGADGMVYFDQIDFPADGGNYVEGFYEIFVRWQNHDESSSLNQTGLLKKLLNVKHRSVVTPAQTYYADVLAGESVNIELSFNDSINQAPIVGGIVYFTNFTDEIQYMTEISDGYYFTELNALASKQGENLITINLNQTHFENLTIDITVEVVIDTSLESDYSPSVTIFWNQNATFDINYTEAISSAPILSATFSDDWAGESWIEEAGLGIYNVHLNTSSYSAGTIETVTISTSDVGYNPVSLSLDIRIQRRPEDHKLYLNKSDETLGRSIEVYRLEYVNVSFEYLDDLSGKLIAPAESTINIDNSKLGTIPLSLSNNIYQALVPTNRLDVGINQFNISASSNVNDPVFMQFTIQVSERPADFELFFNKTDRTSQLSYTASIFQTVNISVNYFDFLNGTSSTILSADVLLTGPGYGDEPLSYDADIYQIEIATAPLGLGVHAFTITASAINFTEVEIPFTLRVNRRDTDYILQLDDVDKSGERSDTISLGDSLNIKFSYYDVLNTSTIEQADVTIQHTEIGQLSLDFIGGLYQIDLDSNAMSVGIKQITLTASKPNCDTITIEILITIEKAESQYGIYLNGFDRTSSPSIDAEITDNIALGFDYYASGHGDIISADVTLSGIGASDITMTYSAGMFQYSVDTEELGIGVHVLTITSESENWTDQIHTVTIKVYAQYTGLSVYSNDTDITLTQSEEVYIGEILNISIDYYDFYDDISIPGASVNISNSILGEIELSEISGIYQMELNSSDLGLGIHFLTISCSKLNYQFNTSVITLNVRQRPSGVSFDDDSEVATFEPGSNFILSIKLIDQNTGKPILGAEVNYSSSFGSGSLSDPDNNGVYTVDITGLPEGSYIVYISVDAGDDFSFQEQQLTVNIVETDQGGGIPRHILYILIGTTAVILALFMSYQLYFKYPKPVRRIRKARKKIIKHPEADLKIKDQRAIYADEYSTIAYDSYPALKKELKQISKEDAKRSEEREIDEEIIDAGYETDGQEDLVRDENATEEQKQSSKTEKDVSKSDKKSSDKKLNSKGSGKKKSAESKIQKKKKRASKSVQKEDDAK